MLGVSLFIVPPSQLGGSACPVNLNGPGRGGPGTARAAPGPSAAHSAGRSPGARNRAPLSRAEMRPACLPSTLKYRGGCWHAALVASSTSSFGPRVTLVEGSARCQCKQLRRSACMRAVSCRPPVTVHFPGFAWLQIYRCRIVPISSVQPCWLQVRTLDYSWLHSLNMATECVHSRFCNGRRMGNSRFCNNCAPSCHGRHRPRCRNVRLSALAAARRPDRRPDCAVTVVAV
jgi:hypothetical protein